MLENYMAIFNLYTNEIIGGAAILILLIIYYMLKKVQQRKKSQVENLAPIVTRESKDDEVVKKAPQQTTTKPKEEPKPKPKQTPIKANNESTLSVKEDRTPPKDAPLTRTKRAVPPHEKIKKENFKEFSGQRILVAEDNLINQKVIGGLLADSGIEIVIADDGQDALDILEKDSNFNIILMDAHMPRVDGFEATRTIRSIPAYDHIVVVALSGDTAADDIKKMTESGMEDQLEKPLRMDALYDVLYAYTRNRSSDNTIEHNSMHTKEIDTEDGLSICGFDEEFYNEILQEFVTTYADSHVVIKNLLNNRQMNEADKYLLDISGTASNIGAKNISLISLALKNAINNPKERRYVQYYKQYVLSLRDLLKDIQKYLS